MAKINLLFFVVISLFSGCTNNSFEEKCNIYFENKNQVVEKYFHEINNDFSESHFSVLMANIERYLFNKNDSVEYFFKRCSNKWLFSILNYSKTDLCDEDFLYYLINIIPNRIYDYVKNSSFKTEEEYLNFIDCIFGLSNSASKLDVLLELLKTTENGKVIGAIYAEISRIDKNLAQQRLLTVKCKGAVNYKQFWFLENNDLLNVSFNLIKNNKSYVEDYIYTILFNLEKKFMIDSFEKFMAMEEHVIKTYLIYLVTYKKELLVSEKLKTINNDKREWLKEYTKNLLSQKLLKHLLPEQY